MNYREILPFVASAGHALFFSVVTAPAVVLFVIVIMTSQSGSLTGWYIDNARSLVGNAPAGMVMECTGRAEPSPVWRGDSPPPQYVKPPCIKTPVDAASYAATQDSIMLNLWAIIAIVALGFRTICWALSDNPSKLSNILSGKKPDVTRCNHDE